MEKGFFQAEFKIQKFYLMPFCSRGVFLYAFVTHKRDSVGQLYAVKQNVAVNKTFLVIKITIKIFLRN